MSLKWAFNPFTGELDAVDVSGRIIVPGVCLPTDNQWDLVYTRGVRTAGGLWVERCNITDTTKMPVVGIILEKSAPTTCLVQLFGPVEPGVLTPGKVYFPSLAGTLTAARPLAPIGSYAMIQTVGVAHDAQVLLLNPSSNMTKVIP